MLRYPQGLATSSTPLSVYQLRIVLRGISPLIWRRVLVPSNITLAPLHTILQILFAWSDEHLHSCHIHGREYGSSGANTHHVRLSDLRLHRSERFRYVYDFGVYWECDIRLEALLPLGCLNSPPVFALSTNNGPWRESVDKHSIGTITQYADAA
jgi:Plasmid pRiA4b ORF-3-like protein